MLGRVGKGRGPRESVLWPLTEVCMPLTPCTRVYFGHKLIGWRQKVGASTVPPGQALRGRGCHPVRGEQGHRGGEGPDKSTDHASGTNT